MKEDTTKSHDYQNPRSSKNHTNIAAENQTVSQAAVAPHNATDTKRRLLQIDGSHLPTRTIHNRHAFASNHSSCSSTGIAPNDWSTTLVVQTTINRLWILKETCNRWKDPIVVVVFVPYGEQVPQNDLSSTCPHLTTIHYQGNEHESEPAHYPINRLRNVALDAVTTSHIFVADVDFVPSMDLHQTIHDALKKQGNEVEEMPHALVVPAFEREPSEPCESEAACAAYLQTNSSFLPHTFADLQHCVQSKDCIVFQHKVNWEGHSSTNSEEWLQRKLYSDESKTNFRTIPCFHTSRYEPYVVLRWCDRQGPVAPYYDERFVGYGKNKIQLISHLRKSGYQFSILPEGFIVHNPHPESHIKANWNDIEGSGLHASMDHLYAVFLQELDTEYQAMHNRTIRICKRH